MNEFKLSNGVIAPALAFGTWLIPNDKAANCVRMALEAGYRHIDTAQAYGNEEGVGQGIRESGLKREDIFVTPCNLHEGIDEVLGVEGFMKRVL